MTFCTFQRHGEHISLAYEILEPANTRNRNETPYVIFYTGGGTIGIRGCRSLGKALCDDGGFRVIIWDRRNTGQSSFALANGTHPLPVEDAMDLCELVKHICTRTTMISFQHVILMGRSAGARVACICARLLGPAHLAGVVFAPPTGGKFAIQELIDLYFENPKQAFLRGDFDTVIRSFSITNPTTQAALRQCDEKVFCAAMDCSATWMRKFENNVFVGATDDELKEIKQTKKVAVLHSGDVHDELHTARTAIGVAHLLQVECLHLVPDLMTRASNKNVAALMKRLFMRGDGVFAKL